MSFISQNNKTVMHEPRNIGCTATTILHFCFSRNIHRLQKFSLNTWKHYLKLLSTDSVGTENLPQEAQQYSADVLLWPRYCYDKWKSKLTSWYCRKRLDFHLDCSGFVQTIVYFCLAGTFNTVRVAQRHSAPISQLIRVVLIISR